MINKNTENLFGLEIRIEKYEEFINFYDEKLFLIYLVIDNKKSINREINLLKATYINNKREQIEQDEWQPGYIEGKDTLMPNSFKKAGLVFYKNKLKTISENDIIYITVELPQEGKELAVSFKRDENKWQMTQVEISDLEIKLTPKQIEKMLLKKIERLDAFEERLNVSIEKLSIKVDNNDTGWFNLLGEIHPRVGTTIDERTELICILYDKEGSILLQKSKTFYSEDFYGFEIFDFVIQEDDIANEVGLIRIYPKKR